MNAIIRKLSTKTVVGNLKSLVMAGLKDDTFADGDVQDVLSLVGIIKKYNEGEHAEFGTYYEFVGSFEGTAHMGPNKDQSFRAPKCFMPEAATELLIEEIQRVAAEHDGELQDVQVAVKIQVRIDESVASNYVYQVVPLIESSQADPLAMIKNQIKAQSPALENSED